MRRLLPLFGPTRLGQSRPPDTAAYAWQSQSALSADR